MLTKEQVLEVVDFLGYDSNVVKEINIEEEKGDVTLHCYINKRDRFYINLSKSFNREMLYVSFEREEYIKYYGERIQYQETKTKYLDNEEDSFTQLQVVSLCLELKENVTKVLEYSKKFHKSKDKEK